MVYSKLFIKGSKQSGKTSLLIRALSDMRPIAGGYAVIDLIDGQTHLPGLIEAREAAADHLPLKMFGDSVYDKSAFLAEYPSYVEEINAKALGYLDPVLGDELSDPKLTELLEALLESPTPLMGVIAPRADTGSESEYDRILSRLERDESTLIIDTDALSESEVIPVMRQWAVSVLDKAHHEKFDPLMKLRAKRRRPEFPAEYKPEYK